MSEITEPTATEPGLPETDSTRSTAQAAGEALDAADEKRTSERQAADDGARPTMSFGQLKPWISLGARLILAGVLGAAGLLKVGDPDASVRAVIAYELLPYDAERIIGYGLPFVEIALAGLVLVGLATRFAASASALLMIGFIVAVASAWARGLSIDCGCFGGGGQVDPDQTRYVEEVARDTALVVLAGWLVIFPSSKFAMDR